MKGQTTGTTETPGSLGDYYRDPNVRARILEFLGGNHPNEVTTVYITANDSSTNYNFEPLAPSCIWQCLDAQMEITRSLWDRKYLLAHLDIEYTNFDFPAEPYQEVERSFDWQRPAVEDIERRLARHGIMPLHILSGRGHHFVWQIAQDSMAFGEMAKLGRVPPSLQSKYGQAHPPHGEKIDTDWLAHSPGWDW